MPELDHLRTFLAIYRSRTVTRAARELSISQPSASAHLKSLEQEVGAPLFVRRGRGVLPTARAHELARQVGPPLDALSGVTRRLSHVTGPERDPVHLGGTVELMSGRVYAGTAPLVADGQRLVLRVDAARRLLTHVANGDLDAAVVDVEPGDDGLEAGPWFGDHAVMVSRPPWVPADPDVGRLRGRIETLPLIGTAHADDLLRRHLHEVLGTELSGPPRVVVPDAVGALSAAVAGCGVAVVPRFLADAVIATGALRAWPSPGGHLRLEYFVVTRRGEQSPAVAAVVEALRAVAAA